MDISCNIIRDLLPLYAEGLTSQDSNALVEGHLCVCDACTRQLGILKKAQIVPVDVETETLKKVGTAIRRRRVMAVLTTLMVVVSILASIFTFLTVPMALPKEDAVISVEKEADGGLKMTVNQYAYIHSYIQDTEDLHNKGMVLWTTRQRMLFEKNSPFRNMEFTQYGYYITEDGKQRTYIPGDGRYQGEEVNWAYELNHWYLNIYNGEAEHLLWDGGAENPVDIQMTQVNPILGWLLSGSILLTVGFAVTSRWMRKPWQSVLMQRLAILAGSIAYADVIVCWNRYVCLDMSNELDMRLQYITALALVVTLTGLLWHQLYRKNRQDRGL